MYCENLKDCVEYKWNKDTKEKRRRK
jgi:hypothetical protein